MFKPTLISSGAITINDNHRFADTSARDTYFASHADELVNLLYIYIEDIETLQQYYTSTASFISVQPVVGIQGDDGADGTNGHSITVNVQASEPATKAVGDIWVDTDDSLFNTADDSVLWNGQALPSIDDATGGQVLALKSDKSALEFATVDLDTLGAASSTTDDMTVYVDSAATGAGDGTSWTDAFTTIQAAHDSLPLIIAHTVVILVRDGTYTENLIVSRQCLPTGSIEIRAEYYWYGTVAATKTGKITLGASDFGYAERVQIEAGDRVIVFKWSGTNDASVPTTSYEDTVASVSGAEVTLTTNTGVSFTSACTYAIIKNSISASSGNAISSMVSGKVSFNGFKIGGTISNGICVLEQFTVCTINACDIYGFTSGGVYALVPSTIVKRSLIRSSETSASGLITSGKISALRTSNGVRINMTGGSSNGAYCIRGDITMLWSHVAAAAVGLRAVFAGTFSNSVTSYCLNEGTTPRSPASSSDPAYIS